MAPDGVRGLVSLLEVPSVQDKPELFSTFLMWLLSELYEALPEVGDIDKPKLVFFFDEAHLLFANASKDFLQIVTQTVRLIRSKGVGIFFVTQSPKDVPGDVLAQLGSRVQHQLRAHTPDDARALKAAVSTYPTSGYDLAQVLQNLRIGEAIVTVMSENGAPSPVAWTRLRVPQSSMTPTPPEQLAAAVAASPLLATYGTPVHPLSARGILEQRASMAQVEAETQQLLSSQARAAVAQANETASELARQQRDADAAVARAAKAEQADADRAERDRVKAAERMGRIARRPGGGIGRRIVEKLFGSTRR
jgi:uncharacterized protein